MNKAWLTVALLGSGLLCAADEQMPDMTMPFDTEIQMADEVISQETTEPKDDAKKEVLAQDNEEIPADFTE